MSDQQVLNETSTESEAENNQRVIEVANPTAEEMAAITENITANYAFEVTTKPVEFKFKKSVDKASGIETIRKPVVLPVPYPSVQGIINILETGGKGLELLLEATEAVVNASVRDLLGESTELSAENFDASKVSWEAIANQPKAQRRGGGIPKETWEEFTKDYCAVMPDATGKTLEQVTNMANILSAKLTPVRTNKDVLALVVQQLAVYMEATEAAAEYAKCVEFLLNKADTFLNVTPEELLSAL